MPGINLGDDFGRELAELAGWDPDTVDVTTLAVVFFNRAGDTTVRVTATANVDTDALSALIRKYTPLSPADTDESTPDPETP